MSDIRRMQLGQLVDFCIDYGERQQRAEKEAARAEQKSKKRKATQGDINLFFG